jgi:diketogulonate reductase-like aldo/keto reductase
VTAGSCAAAGRGRLGAAGRERRTLDDSLPALGMDYVDLWLIHWPPRGRALVSTWKELPHPAGGATPC